MAFFVVSYDLRKGSEFDYKKLYDAFAREDCVKCQESTYLLKDAYSAEQILIYFRALIHDDDLMTVVEFVNKPANHRGLKGTRDWIAKHWP